MLCLNIYLKCIENNFQIFAISSLVFWRQNTKCAQSKRNNKVIMYVTIKKIELLSSSQLLKRQIPHMQDKIYLKAAKICF